jgi:hypothetical protein
MHELVALSHLRRAQPWLYTESGSAAADEWERTTRSPEPSPSSPRVKATALAMVRR